MDVDSRALKVLTDWNGKTYKNEGQKAADLQFLIISALKEQHELTRRECLDVVKIEYENLGDIYTSLDMFENAVLAIAAIKAI